MRSERIGGGGRSGPWPGSTRVYASMANIPKRLGSITFNVLLKSAVRRQPPASAPERGRHSTDKETVCSTRRPYARCYGFHLKCKQRRAPVEVYCFLGRNRGMQILSQSGWVRQPPNSFAQSGPRPARGMRGRWRVWPPWRYIRRRFCVVCVTECRAVRVISRHDTV